MKHVTKMALLCSMTAMVGCAVPADELDGASRTALSHDMHCEGTMRGVTRALTDEAGMASIEAELLSGDAAVIGHFEGTYSASEDAIVGTWVIGDTKGALGGTHVTSDAATAAIYPTFALESGDTLFGWAPYLSSPLNDDLSFEGPALCARVEDSAGVPGAGSVEDQSDVDGSGMPEPERTEVEEEKSPDTQGQDLANDLDLIVL